MIRHDHPVNLQTSLVSSSVSEIVNKRPLLPLYGALSPVLYRYCTIRLLIWLLLRLAEVKTTDYDDMNKGKRGVILKGGTADSKTLDEKVNNSHNSRSTSRAMICRRICIYMSTWLNKKRTRASVEIAWTSHGW